MQPSTPSPPALLLQLLVASSPSPPPARVPGGSGSSCSGTYAAGRRYERPCASRLPLSPLTLPLVPTPAMPDCVRGACRAGRSVRRCVRPEVEPPRPRLPWPSPQSPSLSVGVQPLLLPLRASYSTSISPSSLWRSSLPLPSRSSPPGACGSDAIGSSHRLRTGRRRTGDVDAPTLPRPPPAARGAAGAVPLQPWRCRPQMARCAPAAVQAVGRRSLPLMSFTCPTTNCPTTNCPTDATGRLQHSMAI
eukprot:125654-Chlamydomonas_euryale.AAC.4